MAHEKLRFSLIINDSRKIYNNDEGDVLQQAIFSDDYIGTHFGLFANFIGEKIEDKAGKCFKCSEVNVSLQNYNGNLTVGILKVMGIIPKKEDKSLKIEGSTNNQYYLVIAIQGLNNNFKDSADCDICFYDGDIIETVIMPMPIESQYSQIDTRNPDERNEKALFIDKNYQYRDGESIEWKPNAKDKMRAVRTIFDKGLSEGIDILPKNNILNIKAQELEASGRLKDDAIFTTIGGGRACKMKIADIRIK